MDKARRLIPNRLKMHRKQMRYKQKQVATLLGLYSTTPISEWEQGKKLPSSINLLKLSVVYRTFPNELYAEYMHELRKNITDKEWKIFNANQ